MAEGLQVQREADGRVLEHAEQTASFCLFSSKALSCWVLGVLHKTETIVLILLWQHALDFKRITALVLQQQQQSEKKHLCQTKLN